MVGKEKVSYTKPEEPAFLKRMKEQLGYKEAPTIESKRQRLEDANDDRYDNDDEEDEIGEDGPQIVVLNAGDLSHEDMDKLNQQKLLVKEQEKIARGEVKFKKPDKSAATSSASAITTTGEKTTPLKGEGKEQSSANLGGTDRSAGKAKNDRSVDKAKEDTLKKPSAAAPRLLSFQDDEEEDE